MNTAPDDNRSSRGDSRQLAIPSQMAAPVVVSTARPAAPAHAETAAGINHNTILDAIRFYWKWALPTGLVFGAAAAVAVYCFFVPKYQAAYWLSIEEQVPYLAFEAKDGSDQSRGFVRTQIELLRSPMVLLPVVNQPEIAAIPELAQEASPIDALAKALEIKSVGNSELYTVSFTSSQPKAAAAVANAVVDSYLEFRRDEQIRRGKPIVDQLKAEQEQRKGKVVTLRNQVREKAKELTGKDPFRSGPEPAAPESRILEDLANRLISAEVEEALLQARVRAAEGLEEKRPVQISESFIEQSIATHPLLLKAQEFVEELQIELGHLEEKAARGKNDPAYQRAAKLVEQRRKSIEELKSKLRQEVKLKQATQSSGKWSDDLAALRLDLENRRMSREMFKKRYETELKKLKKSSGDSVELRFAQDELARDERVLDLISERITKLETEQGAPDRVKDLRKAVVPVAPIKGTPYLYIAMASLGGFALPFGLAVLKEQLTRRVRDASSVERHSQLNVLGEITRLPTRNRAAARLGYRATRAVRLFEESVETLRNSLLLGANAQGLRFLTITSAVTEEGKTSVAVQLAVSIARATQERTLVIDGDMRDPSVHKVFQVPLEPGLCNVLSGTCTLPEAVAVTWAEGVDVLPAGVLTGSPHSLFGNARWEKLLKSIPAHYRYVIVDTPPVLAASEALVLARDADAVLICAMRDVTRLPQLKQVAEHVTAAGGRIAGIVLNGTPTSHYAQRYGSYPYLSN